MKYHDALAGHQDDESLPESLRNHLKSVPMEDLTLKYELPPITKGSSERTKKKKYDMRPSVLRVPSRIDNPLIPYPLKLKEFLNQNQLPDDDSLHPHHFSQLTALLNKIREYTQVHSIKTFDKTFNINDLKRLSKCRYSRRQELINLTAISFAQRSTQHELSLTAMDDIKFQPTTQVKSPYLGFLLMCQRLRVLVCAKENHELQSEIKLCPDNTEARLNVYKDGTYIYDASCEDYQYFIIVASGHFALYHSELNSLFIGPSTYFDYALTVSDVINNLEVIRGDKGYQWANKFFDILIKVAESDADHNTVVDFMKGFEGFMLNLSDYDETYPMNWIPILDGAYTLWELDRKMSNVEYDFITVPRLMHNKLMVYPDKSFLCQFIESTSLLNRTNIQELSALHRFIFYAEVDARQGVEKFLKRVHTVRPYEREAVKNLTRLAKKEFLQSYTKKHKVLPELRGELTKINTIKTLKSKNKLTDLDRQPLSWWDDLTIWNCMDNTLTNDALEHSKDKGALKDEIKFGPGDSERELYQVIQKPEYELIDIMKCGPFHRKPAKVEETHQLQIPLKTSATARLIEKEKEQKIEARLFANAELSRKHGLSVVTTKMKKVLSYFSEQMMTPSDSTRKKMLHRSAQSLIIEGNYSVLLDIEGHNQSMQYGNSSELLEFMGNVYGESGWGSLADYFGSLDIFHYDEYFDEVIISNGQHGGIEGWYNPAWTLHTLLMMKLIRYMTDIEMPSLNTYSDDVNCVLRLLQLTEAGIQGTFHTIVQHCYKFGMVIKFSQTVISKHRATILRQHYSDGIKADSTLKRLMAVSGANNGTVVSDELEVAGICSSASSALDMSNHSEICCYLKNYKLGLLLARLPQMILSHAQQEGMLSDSKIPTKLAELLFHVKDESELISGEQLPRNIKSVKNDVARYLKIPATSLTNNQLTDNIQNIFGLSLSQERIVDNADRMLYLQVYDDFLKDLLFFLVYSPSSMGGMGGIYHINMMLSGHSNGTSKSLFYTHEWIKGYASNKSYFYEYLTHMLSESSKPRDMKDSISCLTSGWASEFKISTATSSLNSALKSMVKYRTKNKNVLKLMELDSQSDDIALMMLKCFKNNFHPRIAQFYFENTSIHFLDLLINKIETSSSLLRKCKNLNRIRASVCQRALKNIKIGAQLKEYHFGQITENTDIIEYLVLRRETQYPELSIVKVDEVLYDDKLIMTYDSDNLLTVRKCGSTHIEEGYKIYDDPHFGNETRYKGEYLEAERSIGNKEELMAAKVVAITKWFLTKFNMTIIDESQFNRIDCVNACNIALKTLTGHSFRQLMEYSPAESGGEILHRIPNMRFSTMSYIRSEMNLSLSYTSELSQRYINERQLMDSNINFDYMRYRLMLAMMVRGMHNENMGIISKYKLTRFTGILDVQFIKPKINDILIEGDLISYGEFRNHQFSNLRFRYMAIGYLTFENLEELGIVPTLDNNSDHQIVGNQLLRELIYKHASNMDSNYMLVSYKYPQNSAWDPIIPKLSLLSKDFNELNKDQQIIRIRDLLEEELIDRKNIMGRVSKSNIEELLRSKILQAITDNRPYDNDFLILVKRLNSFGNGTIVDQPLSLRISKYNQRMSQMNEHREDMIKSILLEIIVTLHFNSRVDNGILCLDIDTSIDQFFQHRIQHTYLSQTYPELVAKASIYNLRVLEDYKNNNKLAIVSALTEITSDIQITDMSVPETTMTIKPQYNIENPSINLHAANSTLYTSGIVGNTAMKTFNQLSGLINFSEKCCQYGANPLTFDSPTGSDSFCAQYGIYKHLMSKFNLNKYTRICDLTAGRGDGLYAAQALGLNCEAFSLTDTFTSVMHHPDIRFDKDYDVTKTSTLKFLREYDFIMIDVSFLKSGNKDLSDLLIFLENQSIHYCLRVNSVILDIYSTRMDSTDIVYEHHLAYCNSSEWRSYQIYLIGVPAQDELHDEKLIMKKTPIFRNMALSYGQLIKNNHLPSIPNDNFRNSIQLCLPDKKELIQVMKSIMNMTTYTEAQYYYKRFSLEYDNDESIIISENHIDGRLSSMIERYADCLLSRSGKFYEEYTNDDIGNVSDKSRNFHVEHLAHLHNEGTSNTIILGNQIGVDLLKLLRIHHPIQSIRSKCNVLIGMHRLNLFDHFDPNMDYEENTKNYQAEPLDKLSYHNPELVIALKLMIVSVYHDDEQLPFRYLALINSNYQHRLTETLKIRFRYRMIYNYRHFIQECFDKGAIDPNSIRHIENELFHRKLIHYNRSRPNYTNREIDYGDIPLEQSLELDFETVFESMIMAANRTLLINDSFDLDASYETDNMRQLQENVIINQYEIFGELSNELNFGEMIDTRLSELDLKIDERTGRYEGFEYEDYDEADYDE